MSGDFPLSTNLWTEDDECGVVFLQTLSRRFTSETILERVVNTVISVNGPHHAESLSQTFVPISSHIILAMVAVCCVFTVHEFRVQGGSTPLLATHDGRNTVLLQVSFLITWVVGYLTVTMFIPVSLDFALAMGVRHGQRRLHRGCARGAAGGLCLREEADHGEQLESAPRPQGLPLPLRGLGAPYARHRLLHPDCSRQEGGHFGARFSCCS